MSLYLKHTTLIVDEFKNYIKAGRQDEEGGHSCEDELLRFKREFAITLLKETAANPEYNWMDKANFFAYKGFSDKEIEDALYEADERAFIKYVQYNEENYYVGDKNVDNKKMLKLSLSPSSLPTSSDLSNNKDGSAAVSSAIAVVIDTNKNVPCSSAQNINYYNSTDEISFRPDELTPEKLIRIKSTVFVYMPAIKKYTPTQLYTIDNTRCEDIYGVRFPDKYAEDGYGPTLFYPMGLKGIIADEFPRIEVTNVGDTVVYAPGGYPELNRGALKEAVVVGIYPWDKENDCFYVDLEGCCHDDQEDDNDDSNRKWDNNMQLEVLKKVKSQRFRLLEHPRLLLHRRQTKQRTYRKHPFSDSSGQGSCGGIPEEIESHNSFFSFPFDCAFLTDKSIPDYYKIATSIKSYYEQLSSEELSKPPLYLNTSLTTPVPPTGDYGGNDLVCQTMYKKWYPQVEPSSSALPFSTKKLTSSSARTPLFNVEFDLTTHFRRHPFGADYYLTNPLIALVKNCLGKKLRFVDCKFPAVNDSLGIIAEHKGKLANITWKRLSDLKARPKVWSTDLRPMDLIPGSFTPSWLVGVLHATLCGREGLQDDLISPAVDGEALGLYVVRLFVNGYWTFVFVDDFVPCKLSDKKGGVEILSLRSSHADEVFPCIVEKALAKVEGSYGALLQHSRNTLTPGKVFEALTGMCSDILIHFKDLIMKEDTHSNLQVLVNDGTVQAYASPRIATAKDNNNHNYEKSSRNNHIPDNYRVNNNNNQESKKKKNYVDYGIHPHEFWYVDAIERAGAKGDGVVDGSLFLYHVVKLPSSSKVSLSAPLGILAQLGNEGTKEDDGMAIRERVHAELPAVLADEVKKLEKRFTICDKLGQEEGFFSKEGEKRLPLLSFWMSSIDYLHAFEKTIRMWRGEGTQFASFQGTFRGFERIGDRVLDGLETWLRNPQFALSTYMEGDVMIELQLLDRSLLSDHRPIDGETLQFYLLKPHGAVDERLTVGGVGFDIAAAAPPKHFHGDAGNEANPSTMVYLPSLPSYTYIIIPSIGFDSSEDFVLKFISTSSFNVRALPNPVN